MKQSFLLLVIFLVSISSLFSQIEKGTVMVGGNAGFQFKANNQHEREFGFSVSPNALYSVIKQLALGGQISYSYNNYKDSNPLKPYPQIDVSNSFSIGPAARANIHIGGKTFFFFHASSSFGIQTIKQPNSPDKINDSYSIIAWRMGPGVSIFATKNMAVELGIFYDGRRKIRTIKFDKSVFYRYPTEITHGLTFAVGLQFYAHKKQKQLEPVNSSK